MTDNEKDSANGVSERDRYAQLLLVFNPLRESIVRSAIQALQLPLGSRGLDAGCGIGQPSLMLAEAVGSTGHVTGLDIQSELLVCAREIARENNFSERISFEQGDINKLPFENETFDWVWSMDCVGYCPWDPLPPLKELVRVVKPGGKVAILFWSSQNLLPGYPILEAQLNATSAGIAPFDKKMRPQSHFLRGLSRFREAGLEGCKAQTFAGDVHAPLKDEMREALSALFQMRWEKARSETTAEFWAQFQRLCQPESSDFILNLPDYYAFFTYTMFQGRVAQ
ncbi:methyltransferase domain-containing protein [Planctomycetota bacterium]